MTGARPVQCPWCGKSFEPRTVGAYRKRFCSPRCRCAYHAAVRKWGRRELDQGRVTVADLKAL